MPAPPPPRPVLGRSALARLIVASCVVVIMLAVAVIALKLGVRDDRATTQAADHTPVATASSNPAPTTTSSAAAPTAASSGVARIAGPETSTAPRPKAPKTPRIPTKPSDLGVLVNKSTGLDPTDYAPQDISTVNGQPLRAEAAKALRSLLSEAAKDGHPLQLLSGYRSAAEQESLRHTYVNRYGEDYANTISAPVGHSEHQTGLAADVGNGRCDLKACFGDTPAGKWLAKNAEEFGFIIRYPEGQEKATGYAYEPWHLRYVGKDLVKKIGAAKAKTLEAYYDAEP